MPGKFFKQILLTTSVLFISISTFAQNIKVAAAANLQSVMAALQKDCKQRTGIEIEPIIGASGKLTAQISNGAPYDVFMSADMTFPATLYKSGFATKAPVAYANGSLIVCSTKDLPFRSLEKLLLSNDIKKIAIANPKTAPYGTAAEQWLNSKKIMEQVRSKIVYGESISQVNTYITTGVVDVGFTTQSFTKDTVAGRPVLYSSAIDMKTYSPIQQGIVIIKHDKINPDAERFYNYILGPSAKKVFKDYGYKLP